MHTKLITRAGASLYLWNLNIKASVTNGFFAQALQLYSSMFNSGRHPNNFTFPLVFKACGKLGSTSLRSAKKVHAHAFLTGYQGDVFVQTALLDMYSKCSTSSFCSRQLFDEMPVRSLVSWNSMISAYSKDFQIDKSFDILKQMLLAGLEPSSSTFVNILSGFSASGLGAFPQGLLIHCYGIKLGLDSHLQLSNSIMSMYMHSDQTDAARTLFSLMPEKSIISWTIIMCGYVSKGAVGEAFYLFNRMRQEQVCLDSVLFIHLISGCAHVGRVLIASSVHALIVKTGYNEDDSIANSLVNMYVKCGNLLSASTLFDLANEKSVFLWTSMISGYVQLGYPNEALGLFKCLLKTATKPNEVTLATVLSACADLGSISLGAEVEDYIRMNGFDSDLRVQTSLIHMYCKCGSLERAKEIFERASCKDVTMWSSMINGFALHGFGEEALSLFHQLQRQEGYKPDGVVFTGVLSACSHSGLVEDGLKYFNTMQTEFGIKPSIEHYSLLVDLLGRAGHFDLALKTIDEMPVHAQSQAWVPLLSACKSHGNIELGEYVSKKLFDVAPQNVSNYIIMANIFAAKGKWKEAAIMRKMMERRRMAKEPGWSQIEVQ